MPKASARANARKSAIRARVEHVFAHQKNRMFMCSFLINRVMQCYRDSIALINHLLDKADPFRPQLVFSGFVGCAVLDQEVFINPFFANV